MKKLDTIVKTLFALATIWCVSLTATGQSISQMATFDEDAAGGAPVAMLKAAAPAPAPAFVPMDPHPGDVNCDGQVTIDDVTALIDILLSGETNVATSADANGDGTVSIDDVTYLIDMLLSGENDCTIDDALRDLDEIYRSMHTAGWTTPGNTHQAFGISAYNLMAEVMGDDMIMGAQGSGWFWFDAGYNVKGRYTSDSWRSHDLWTAYYTWIANANYILEASKTLTSSANYVRGQAYAIRAYSYFMLAQSFARTYKGHENDPCVPIFDGVVFNGSTGQLRSTVAEVYAQIESDINEAVNLLHGTTQQKPSHISYAVALGLRSRINLVEEKWSNAYLDARNAITAFESTEGKGIQEVADFKGLNDVSKGNVMWGVDIPTEDVGMYASLWPHMNSTMAYGQKAPKQISKWLYNKMSATDTRRAWWKTNDTGYGSDALVQDKFDVVEGTQWDGDYIWMRVEEMYLNAAEALAHRGGFDSNARSYLNQLMAKRDANYPCTKSGNDLGSLTTDETGSLLEEILIQRRIELWGEDGRIYTIRRLRQGFERTAENGWPTGLLLQSRSLNDPESYPWVLTIPLSEFNNYYSWLILAADQNPIGDYPEGNAVEIERTPQHLSFGSPTINLEISGSTTTDLSIGVSRTGTSSKPYYALLRLTEDGTSTERWYYVTFAPGQSTSDVIISFDGTYMAFGRHTFTLSLTDLEMSVANSNQLTSTKIVVDVKNFGAEGQHISFETANQNEEVNSPGFQEVKVTLTRAVTTYDYRATVKLDAGGSEDIRLANENVYFKAGESTATATLYFYDTEINGTYSCVLTLSDADVATGNPSLGEQITSTTIMVKVKNPNEGWVDAGTCTFTDYTWEDGLSASNVSILNKEGTNQYCIVSPLSQVYTSSYSEGQGDTANWYFYLNDDGSISAPEGESLNYWGYYAYYVPTTYPSYCYITQDGNTYDVHFILKYGASLYQGGRFTFTWDRN